jgi:plasmid stabilization system protein ParE
MGTSFVLLTVAWEDLDGAMEWYDARELGLGGVFLGRVEVLIERIVRMPRLYARTFKKYRFAKVKRHPYLLVYHYDLKRDLVVIHAIFHSSRNIAELKARLR